MKTPLWQPSETTIAASEMTRFSEHLMQTYELPDTQYSTIHEWSIQNPKLFWQEVWEDCDVKGTSCTEILKYDHIQNAKWFECSKLNFAQNLLKPQVDTPAIISIREQGSIVTLSHDELYEKVASCAHGLREMGVQVGDRVAGVLPNGVEAVVASLASISVGAIWSSCSPDFGVNGIQDRLGQIQPKVLFSINAYSYNGKTFDVQSKLKSLLKSLEGLEKLVLIPYLEESDAFSLEQDQYVLWDDFCLPNTAPIHFEQLPFDHPIYILYSSGTTGAPKSIVHGAGGTLLQHMKEHRYHCDLKPQDRMLFYTTCGWMMWNWMISALASEVTVVLYEGSPTFPKPSRLWEICERHEITHLGVSPKYLKAIRSLGYSPKERYMLRSLRCLMSTGAPLSVPLYHWVYENVKSNLHLASISGGTDIIGCFMLGNPNLPVHEGEIQCKGLGMSIRAYAADQQPVSHEKGELVCEMPFPSMPVMFWNDETGKKYHDAYFSQIPGKWVHGDFIKETINNGIIVYGRSDTTLNPGGVRIGTAEIYRQLETLDIVLDSIVVGQDWEDDVRILLFVVLKEGHPLTDEVIQTIKQTIRTGTTPRHVPQYVLEVADIPRTISGKKVEKAVSHIMNGKAIDNLSALANPESLEAFKQHHQNLK